MPRLTFLLLALAALLSACAPAVEALAEAAEVAEEAVETVAAGATLPVLELSAPTPSPAPPSPTPVRDTDQPYSTIDRPDDQAGYQVHFVYVLPSDGVDRFMDLSGQIELSANAANHWLARRSEGLQLRYDTFEGALDISFLRLPYSAEQLNALGKYIVEGLEHSVRQLGFDTSRKIYVFYYDGLYVLGPENLACGQATFPPQGRGVSALIFLRGYSPKHDALTCPALSRTPDYADWLELVLLHEVFHVLGAAAECGPNAEAGHVSDSESDLMSNFYNRVGPSHVQLDWNRDDYFGHALEDCPDLAKSVFMEPLPEGAEEPPGWARSSGPKAFNPFKEAGVE